MLALLLPVVHANPPCPQPVRATRLANQVDRAIAAFSSLDAPRFDEAIGQVRAGLPCTRDQVSGRILSRVHLALALDAVLRDQPDVLPSLAAGMKDAWPEAPLPAFLPLGHPVRDAYDAQTAPPSVTSVPVPEAARLLMNGTDRLDRPDQTAVVAQLIGPAGEVIWTRWLPAGAPLPAYAEAPPATRLDYDNGQRVVVVHRERRPVGLLVASVLTGVAAGGLYGGAWASRQQFKDGESTRDWDRAKVQTNVLAGTSAGLGLLAGGLGITTAVTW